MTTLTVASVCFVKCVEMLVVYEALHAVAVLLGWHARVAWLGLSVHGLGLWGPHAHTGPGCQHQLRLSCK